MIQLQFENVNELWSLIDRKITGIEELVSSSSKNEIAKAVFTITSKRFLKDLSIQAGRNPLAYHHIYEWNSVGNNNQKLFKIKRGTLNNGNLNISLSFTKSKSIVPIPPELKVPGKSGKIVKKKHIFANKAEVMESGRPVTFTTKQYIAFLSNQGNIKFIGPNRLVEIMNPGGKKTSGSFDKFVTKWYGTKVDSTIRSSGLFQNIGKTVATTLNEKSAGKVAVREAIKKVSNLYSEGAVEF